MLLVTIQRRKVEFSQISFRGDAYLLVFFSLCAKRNVRKKFRKGVLDSYEQEKEKVKVGIRKTLQNQR